MKNENDKVHISKTAFQEWLEKLQQESWQLELLISGFALFAIWEARILVDGFDEYTDLQNGVSYVTNLLLVNTSWFITIAWRIFFFNLLIHVIARGMWIGAIGLRYVSSEIDYEFLDYAPRFENFLQKKVGDFDDYIEKLERFSSVVFAYTFLLFFIFLSLVLFFVEIGFIFSLLEKKDAGLAGFFIIFILSIGLIAFIDFITMGGIKRIKEKNISAIYFVIYRIISFLTLSFLYRPLLYNFWDEKYTRRLFLVSIPYIFFLSIIPRLESVAYPYFPIYHHGHTQSNMAQQYSYGSEFYDDERALVQAHKKGIFTKNKEIKVVSLPSIEMSGNFGWFFLRSYPRDAQYLESQQNIIPYKKSGLVMRHFKDTRKDSLYEEIEINRSAAKVQLIKARQELSKQLKKGVIPDLKLGFKKEGEKHVISDTYWSSKKDSIDQYWDAQIDAFQKNKLRRLNNEIFNLAEVFIDDIPYNEKCDCKFYIHPNIGERGLRCYFPIKELAEGPHLMLVKRKRFHGSENQDVTTDEYHIPFYKINRNN